MGEPVDQTPKDQNGGAGSFALDVVGIGALNLDFIAAVPALPVGAESSSLRTRMERLTVGAAAPIEWGAETVVDEKTIYAALEEVSTASLDATLGGSAFNAIFALTQMQLGLRLGFVGAAGRVPIPGLSGLAQFARLGVDHTHVRYDDSRACGICFSLADEGDRTLLTYPGANAGMADLIDAEFEALAAYLASAQVIHVTSLLDPRSPERLLDLIRATKEISPSTMLSFDPGHGWSAAPTPAVAGLLQLSDFLLLNHREFKALGEHRSGDSEAVVAGKLVRRFDNDRSVVIVKRTDGVLACRQQADGVAVELFSQTPLPPAEIRDATGAGDIFAAGLLAVLAGDRMQVELGSLLGMQLARHKLQYVGSQGHAELASIAKEFIRSRDAERRQVRLPGGVFVAHGGGEQWHVLKEFIEQECGLPAYAFESGAWESRNVTEALAQYLDRCSFAVCVLTAEDATQDGRRLPRQNVIHEAGLFQGRYGFDRVLLLIEEGCDFVAGSPGLVTATFPPNAIETVFWRLHKMIRTEGFFRRSTVDS
jgi:sugar/nucleoside kinase (ribokinase family)